ncbi:MAG: beta-ketoacyl-ACP synthase II [Thermodesulfovibrionales bacterium]
MQRVVITGIGAVTPLGDGFPGSWAAACSGFSGVRAITKFDASGLPWSTAGEIRGLPAHCALDEREKRRYDPFVHYAVSAAREALAAAGYGAGTPLPENSGVIIGSGRGGISMLEQAWNALSEENRPHPGRRRISPSLMPATTISMAASAVMQKAAVRGFCLGISNACASGAVAIGEAFRMISAGFPGPVAAGGSDAPVCRICVEGYGVSGALSKSAASCASRPFDRDRDGFVLAEGACVLILENLEAARRRNAPVLAELVGYANAADAGHQTQPSRDGEERAIRAALASAGVAPSDIGLVFAHGTSTRIGDRIEAESLRSVLGERADHVPVTAVKSMTGHMLAGSSAFEVGCAAMGLHDGVIPPTINVHEQDPECRIRLVRERSPAEAETALVNSFGFGGVNAALVLRRFRG